MNNRTLQESLHLHKALFQDGETSSKGHGNAAGKTFCTYRTFNDDNTSSLHPWTYGIETAFHELLAQSPHRTLDPEEADFFYAPIYTACFAHPIHGWADFPW